jgi:hypothetical protein
MIRDTYKSVFEKFEQMQDIQGGTYLFRIFRMLNMIWIGCACFGNWYSNNLVCSCSAVSDEMRL